MSDNPEQKMEQKPILWGVPAIAEALGIGKSAAYHLIAQGRLPHRRVGRTIVCRRDQLLAAFSCMTDAESEVA
jgi:excisionase family DNA binding protein